jgi:proline iminopeptidase
MAKAFLYYSINYFFLKSNQILAQMPKIAHLPAIIIHDRWDAVDLPEAAFSLHKNWAAGSALWIIPDGSHSAYDPAIAKALAAATDLFIDNFSGEH